MKHIFSVDVEDWFNILDADCVPTIDKWGSLESRFAASLDRMLELFDKYNTKVTFFWLGWFAERNPELVRKCITFGHEVASHGYGHLLAYQVGREKFSEDISHSKKLLEDIVGKEVKGFRAAGFSTTDDTKWVFDEITKAGYYYDSSVFPTSRGHGGMQNSDIKPFIIPTDYGNLLEFPQSVVSIAGKRLSLFGGGYLRLAPYSLIKRGVKQLEKEDRMLIVYVHPREIDPAHPRLPLPLIRRFKCYVNLNSTFGKLEHLLQDFEFVPMLEYYEQLSKISR